MRRSIQRSNSHKTLGKGKTMADVTLTASLRSNLLSLQGTQRLLDETQLRLATGKKVNSALDNPNSFFASQSLTNRASDLTRLLDGIGQGVQTLKAADEGIKSLTKLVEQAQAIAQEARDQATGGALVVGTAEITSAQAQGLVAGGAVAAGDSFTVQLGTGATTEITIGASTTLQGVVDQLNNINGLRASIVDTDGDGDVNIRLQSTNGQDIVIANGTNTAGTALFGAGAGVGVGTTTATSTAPQDQMQLQNDFNEIRSQIDDLIADASYRGTNLLNNGNLTVDFNEDGTSSLTIAGVDFSSSGLGIDAAAGASDFSTIARIDAQLDSIKGALDTMRAQARTFGNNLNVIQTREDFTSNLINVLKEGSDKLTLADTNEEGAKLLSLQTSQQLGITSLSLASQAQQAVLRLF